MDYPGILLNKRCYQCCKCYKGQCKDDFKKVLDLKKSGLSVYVHHKCEEKNTVSEEKYDAVILSNTTKKHCQKSSFLSEIGQHNVQCFKCRDIIQRVRNLLAEINYIKGNQTIGICDYCKKANISNCKRCEYIVSKFLTSNSDVQEEKRQYLIAWVRKVINSLQFSVEGSVCKHNLNIRDNCVEELQRLLNELESPLYVRQPNYFKLVMNKVVTSLQFMLEGFIDKYKLNARAASVEELQRLLNEFKMLSTQPISMHQPNIESFPIIEEIKSVNNLKVMELLEKIVSRFSIESEKSSNVSYTTFLLKARDSRKIVPKTSFDNMSYDEYKNAAVRAVMNEINKNKENDNIQMERELEKSEVESSLKLVKRKYFSKNVPKNKISENKNPVKQQSNKIYKTNDKNIEDKTNAPELEKQIKNKVNAKNKAKKVKRVSYTDKREDKRVEGTIEKELEEKIKKSIMQKLGKKEIQKENKIEAAVPNTKVPDTKIRSMLDLPIRKKIELLDNSSSSVIECEDTKVVPNVMIKRQHIIPLNPHYGKQDGSTSPVQYQVLNSISNTLLALTAKGQSVEPVDASHEGVRNVSPGISGKELHKPQQEQSHKVPLLLHVHKKISSRYLSNSSTTKGNVNMLPALAKSDKSSEKSDKGVIKYQLSDEECITKGWTQLPSLKIMRRINIYKMEPVNTGNNWFDRNKKSTILYNGSDETFADIDEFGYGKLYYKNGRVALNYYKAEEPNVTYRYVVYSDGEPKNGVPEPVTILGVFDGTGCGVVYDNYGRERLKYNQCEGMVIDKAIDSPCKWKWHTLNDPPILQPVFMDTFSKDTSSRKPIESEDENRKPNKNVDMLAIELENFMKEKADKLLQKFKPFEIKSKTFKLNQQFSLQILHQTSIYLVFREGLTYLKLNLGSMLISNEIVGTESQDVSDLYTPYNRFPARSESVENIQKMLGSARNSKKKKRIT